MDDGTIGRALRLLRIRRGWTQQDMAAATGVSAARISRVERAQAGALPLETLRRLFSAVGARSSFHVRLQGGELDRLLDARHASMEDLLVRRVGSRAAWLVEAEVTFSIFGERGAIDLIAWNAAARALLIVEIKSELLDIGGLVRQTDRYRRLAGEIVRSRGWRPRWIGVWVVVADGRTARRRLADHRALLRSAYPDDGHAVAAWLTRPDRNLRALSFLPIPRPVQAGRRAKRSVITGQAHPPDRFAA